MNAVAILPDALTKTDVSMTSREIAELVEKRHDNVKRTIETLADQGVIVRPQIEGEQETDTMGRPRATAVYVFTSEQGKRDSIVVVAQLSPKFTARLVDRWLELEARAREPAITPAKLSRLQLIQLALDAESERLVLEQQVKEQAPKVEGFDRIADAQGSLCMRDAAKSLQIRPVDLKNWLIVNRWIYGRPGHYGWLAYQDRIQSGHLTHKVNTVHREDGTEKVVEQVRITGKGIARISQHLMAKAA